MPIDLHGRPFPSQSPHTLLFRGPAPWPSVPSGRSMPIPDARQTGHQDRTGRAPLVSNEHCEERPGLDIPGRP